MERVYCRRLAMWFTLYLLGDISVKINQCISTYDDETGVKATPTPYLQRKAIVVQIWGSIGHLWQGVGALLAVSEKGKPPGCHLGKKDYPTGETGKPQSGGFDLILCL